jgi:acyl-CoA dehydrogenase
VRPIDNMVNHETNELFFEDLELPGDSVIGAGEKASRSCSTASTPSAR